MEEKKYYNKEAIAAYMNPFKDAILEKLELTPETTEDLAAVLDVVSANFKNLHEAVLFFKRRMHEEHWPLILEAYGMDTE